MRRWIFRRLLRFADYFDPDVSRNGEFKLVRMEPHDTIAEHRMINYDEPDASKRRCSCGLLTDCYGDWVCHMSAELHKVIRWEVR